MATATQSEIDSFVHRVVGWSQTLQQCAEAAVGRAHAELAAGTITFAEFNEALQNKIAVTQSCIAMIDAASGVLLVVAEAQLAPIEQATLRLKSAATKLKAITHGLEFMSELVVASAALVTALATPGLATIAAAATAVITLTEDIVAG